MLRHPIKAAVSELIPYLEECIESIASMPPETIANDETYKELVIMPSLLAISASSNGLTKKIDRFQKKFITGMLVVRDELIYVDKNQIALITNYKNHLPGIFMRAFLNKSIGINGASRD